MSESALRGPHNAVKNTEHPVADVANATRLAAAIPERPEVLARLHPAAGQPVHNPRP